MTLDVVIATYKPEGIHRVENMNLPLIPGIRYIISWQAHQNVAIPEKLNRNDILILRSESIGLSANRNNAILHSTADIIYIADDDIEIFHDTFINILNRFSQYPDTDVATFMLKETNPEHYPKEIADLGFYLPKNYNILSYCMAFRSKVKNILLFNTTFGINSGVFESGEDELFHLQARKKGLKCRFFPDIIASHPDLSTGERKITDRRIVLSMGAIITLSYPRSFLLRLLMKAYRLHIRRQYPFSKAIPALFEGSMRSFKLVDDV